MNAGKRSCLVWAFGFRYVLSLGETFLYSSPNIHSRRLRFLGGMGFPCQQFIQVLLDSIHGLDHVLGVETGAASYERLLV